MSFRVIYGIYGGRNLFVPKTKEVRPTSDKTKTALFNILGTKVIDAEVLDLFSGSGALGIEAISRGAKHVVFSDIDTKHLMKNIDLLKIKDGFEIIEGNFIFTLSKLKKEDKKFDIIFLDPPYKEGFGERAIEIIQKNLLLKKDGVITFEHSRQKQIKDLIKNGFVYDERTYGSQALSFIKSNKD